MDNKRNWLWKRKSSERSSGETESSGSISLQSERYSDEQEVLKESLNNNTQSPEVTSKATDADEEIQDSIKALTEKLSAALVNVSAKEDLVKQHAKVAEEAVAGWEKAENEAAALKQQLEAAFQQNAALEVRVSHLDGALKECVRQVRQANEEQEQRIHDVVVAKTNEWESTKAELEIKILELQSRLDAAEAQTPGAVNPEVFLKLESLEKENSELKSELIFQSEELEIRTIERDLSAQAAENASKQQLESIKKVAKLEAECRRLQAFARKSPVINDQKSVAATSIYVDSLTDSQSDTQPSCSDSWASALIAELDQFKNEKVMPRNLTASSVEIDMMDDFLEMERLAALHDTKTKIPSAESRELVNKPTDAEKNVKAELETMIDRVAELEEKLVKIETEKAELEYTTSHMAELQEKLVNIETEKAELEYTTNHMVELQEKLVKIEAEKAELEYTTSHMAELQNKLVKIEGEKAELEKLVIRISELEEKLIMVEAENADLENNLIKSRDSLTASQAQLGEAEIRLEELEKELASATESKKSLDSQLISMETEVRTMAANINSLKAKLEKEQNSSIEMAAKCRELEIELKRKYQEVELHSVPSSNGDVKVKQEDLAVAADRLAECQQTIASLGRQLQSLATLEDFLIDTTNLPGFSGEASVVPRDDSESWKLHSNGTFVPRSNSDPSETPGKRANHSQDVNDGESPASTSSSTSSTNNVLSSKNRNGFGKLFSRSKNGAQLDNHSG